MPRAQFNLRQFLPLEQHVFLSSENLLVVGAISANPAHLGPTHTTTAKANFH